MPKFPCDPQYSPENTNWSYKFIRRVSGDNLTYKLIACLENKSDPDAIPAAELDPSITCPNGVGIMRTEP